MSITINTDLAYIQSKLNISTSKMETYQNKSIEEIIQTEAAEGNQAAIQLAADMFTNVSQLVELFQLADPENKLAIMSEMTGSQLEKLVPMLETNDLVIGLNYFTQDTLLDLVKDIPKEELVKMVFQLFSQQQVINFMPEEQMDKLLTGTDMNKQMLLNNLERLPEIYLQQVYESVSGKEANGNAKEMVAQIGQLGDLDYKNAIKNLQPTQKKELTYMLANQETKLFEKFDTDAYTKIINREREKDEMVKGMSVIRPEFLQKMITELPQDLLAIVTTQIDTDKFADALINKFPELLAQIVAS